MQISFLEISKTFFNWVRAFLFGFGRLLQKASSFLGNFRRVLGLWYRKFGDLFQVNI